MLYDRKNIYFHDFKLSEFEAVKSVNRRTLPVAVQGVYDVASLFSRQMRILK
jgi:hypothetical protein